MKHIIHDKYDFSTPFLGLADTLFLLSYTVGFLLCGKLGEWMAVTHITIVGLMGMGLLYLLTAALFWTNMMKQEFYAGLWLVEGPFQSAILLGSVAITFNWFPPETRGTVMGIWGISFAIGNIVGEALSGIMAEELHLEWEWIVTTPSAMVLAAAAMLFLFITDYPHIGDVTDVETLSAPLMIRDVVTHKEAPDDYEKEDHIPHLSWREVLRLPGVLLCSISYGGIKLLNFGFMMWLPYFFEDNTFHMNMEETGFILSFYDIGNIIGCILGGYFSDKVQHRASILAIMLGLVCPAIIAFPFVGVELEWMFYILVPILGCMVAGGSNLMLTAVMADLSQDVGHKETKTAVIGIVSAIGTLGAAIGQVIVGELILFGWEWVFAWFLGKD